MSKEMQPQEAGVQANPLMPGAEIMAGAQGPSRQRPGRECL